MPDSHGGHSEVIRPAHYCNGSIECIDAIESAVGEYGFRAFLVSQVIKYVWRYKLKGKPLQDLEKASFYLNRLIEKVKDAS